MRDDVLVGVAGAGKWGANHVATAASLGILGAVCDADPALLEKAKGDHPHIRTTASFGELLRMPIDAVILATPAQTHARLALQAIDAGKHVFVEKPLALDVADAERVVEAARKRGVRVFVGHLVLYQQGVRIVLERVRSGCAGEVRHVRARRASFGRLRFVEDVWWSFAPHDVSIVLQLMGEEPLEGSLLKRSYVTPGVADFAYADYLFSRGRTAHVESTWLDPNKISQLDVFGTRRTLSLREGAGKATLRIVSCGERTASHGRPELWRGDETTIEIESDEPLRTELQSFVGMLTRGERVPSDGDAGVAVVRALSLGAPASQPSSELYERIPV